MVASIAGKRLAGLLPILLLAGAPALAGDDGAHPAQQPRGLPVDVETSAALAPKPGDQLRLAATVDQDALKAAVQAYRRGGLREGDAISGTVPFGVDLLLPSAEEGARKTNKAVGNDTMDALVDVFIEEE